MRNEILGVVVSGGLSTRMGIDKASIKWAESTLIDRAVAVLAETCSAVVVAGGKLAPVGIPLVADATTGKGPLAGMDSVYGFAGESALFVLAVDLPLVDTEIVAGLISQPIDRDGVRIPVVQGRDQPLCGLYGAGVGSVVKDVLASDDRSMAHLLKRVATVERVPHEPAKFLNVNTPEDLDEALRKCGLPPSTR